LDKSYPQHENAIATGDKVNTAFHLNSVYQRAPQGPHFITERDYFSRSVISPSLASDIYDFRFAQPGPNNFCCQTSLSQCDLTLTGHLLPSICAPNGHSFQQQDAITDNIHQINTAFGSRCPSSAYQQASQCFAHITADRDYLNYHIIPPLTFNDRAVSYSNVPTFEQLDGTLHLSEFSSSNYLAGSIDSSITQSQSQSSASTDDQLTATNFTKLPVPISSITTAPASTDINISRFKCDHPDCTKTFARSGDLRRHSKKHGTPEYPCLINGCDRIGDKAFYRSDKLHDHQRKIHQMKV
jgi:hypothetical protein